MPDDVDENGEEVSDAMSENGDEDDTDMFIKDEDDKMADQNVSSDNGTENNEVKKKYDPKDPSRPRRKKARRACFACQRAHLTCGDERPCQRCIKRGLGDQCQDGVRKKAKYLHDAPPEALRPVLGPNFDPNTHSAGSNGHKHHGATPSDAASMAGTGFVSLPSTASYPVYSPGAQTPVGGIPDGLAYPPPATSPVSPSFQTRPNMGPMSMMPDLGTINAMFDPSNPAIFNFNLENLDFGSNYPALEFGILGHMAGAIDTPPRDPNVPATPGADVNLGMFGGNNGQFGPATFEGAGLSDFSPMDPSAGFLHGNLGHGLPHAYAIAANAGGGGTGLASPSTDNTASPQPNLYEGSPTAATYPGPQGGQAPPRTKTKPAKAGPQSMLGKRRRDASYIYDAVKEPYPYLAAFHNLIAFLQKRYSSNKITKIAKSLASIRPSFMACTKTLTRQDLIFMEVCFQRTLFEYEEDIMQHVCAPTIVCRRTGEVAAVNREFCALTGWSKEVLLGKVANLNVNTGSSNGGWLGPGSDPSSQQHRQHQQQQQNQQQQQQQQQHRQSAAGLTTPRLKTATLDSIKATNEGRPQPVFIPELLDDDSVVEFYEDFAELAFENSRGRVTRKCRLLKYRTAVDTAPVPSDGAQAVQQQQQQQVKDPRSGVLSKRVYKIDSEHGVSRIEKDGKIDVTYCWEIKRDTFNIPMLIIMNFLPCYHGEERHLLPV